MTDGGQWNPSLRAHADDIKFTAQPEQTLGRNTLAAGQAVGTLEQSGLAFSGRYHATCNSTGRV
jgi:hypothetical protein